MENLSSELDVVNNDIDQEVEPSKIKPLESISNNEIAFAINDFAHGKLETAINLYEKYGMAIFRKLPEKFWKIKGDKIVLYRALRPDELETGPVMFGGNDPKQRIQRLTSWSWDSEFPKTWGTDTIVVQMDADQDDVAFAPLLLSPHHRTEKEVVVADYHLKRDKIHRL